jgi:hypothetical protein
MSHYIVEEKLDSTQGQKISSGLMATVITALLLGILWFVRITMPNPPLDLKEGVLELDMGVVDGGFGDPNSGGPSPTPPALGDNSGDGGGSPDVSGGEGKVVTNEGENSVKLPPIDPPKRGDQTDPNLAKRLKVGKRSGTGSQDEGNPNGWVGGKGKTGSGKGGNDGGITGDKSGTNPGNKGKGFISAKFNNFKLISDVEQVQAEGSGLIIYEVRVECNGSFRILGGEVSGSNYTGSDSKAVFISVLSRSSFKKIGENCPEQGFVTVNVKKSL